jgi:hypothetical protein
VDGSVPDFEWSGRAHDDRVETTLARVVDIAHVEEASMDTLTGRPRVAADARQQQS